MNNKGMTLIELLITFSLLMIIVVGMFNLILDAKSDLDNKQITKDFLEYSNFINSDIQYDLMNRKPVAVAIKKTEADTWTCTYSDAYAIINNCTIVDNKFQFNNVSLVLPNIGNNIKITGELDLSSTSVCHDIYPCAVYAYLNSSDINNTTATAQYTVIAINTKLNKGDSGTGYGYGIEYGSPSKVTFEEVPNQSYLERRTLFASMNVDKQKNFVINVPIYMTGNNRNYGFKVVYPLYSIEKTKDNLGNTIK